MSEGHEATRLRNRAQELIRADQAGGLMVRRSGRVGQPVPVLGPGGALHAWFVPVTVDELLAGFFEFRPDLTLTRYSSFQRRQDSLDGCPAAGTWLDVNSILQRAKRVFRPDEQALPPYLTFDESPSRLAWAVVLESPGGKRRTVFVAGDAVWEQRAAAPETGPG